MERGPALRSTALLVAAIGSLGISYRFYEIGMESSIPQPAPIAEGYPQKPCPPDVLDLPPISENYKSGNQRVPDPDPCDLHGTHSTGDASNVNITSVEIRNT